MDQVCVKEQNRGCESTCFDDRGDALRGEDADIVGVNVSHSLDGLVRDFATCRHADPGVKEHVVCCRVHVSGQVSARQEPSWFQARCDLTKKFGACVFIEDELRHEEAGRGVVLGGCFQRVEITFVKMASMLKLNPGEEKCI